MAIRHPRRAKLPASLKWLSAVDLFVGASAVAGGAALVADPSGAKLHMPLSLLEHSPFDTFLVPGLVLAVVVGGSALLAGLAHLARWRLAGQTSLLAGVILVGWLAAQLALIRDVHWLHGLYLVLALTQMGLSLRALSRATARRR